ncbi:mCG148419 [Mus musculus]|nr:mCG148419 [Mus musculus]
MGEETHKPPKLEIHPWLRRPSLLIMTASYLYIFSWNGD